MKLIVGLGNPGSEYSKTRHNAGFMMLDELSVISYPKGTDPAVADVSFQMSDKFEAEIARIDDVLLVKPQTFMNASGKTVAKLVNFYKIDLDDLWVIHDDLDLKLGEYKIQKGVGPKVHNGVNSIEERLGEKDFWRVRIGVDNRDQGKGLREKGEDYVLDDFKPEEKKIVAEVIEKAVDELCKILKLS